MARPHYDSYRDLAEALRRKARALDLPCHLCGRQIDWDADWRDQWSYTYDHDVPIAAGGDPRGPGKQAHRSCNARRSDQVAYEPVKRPRTTKDWTGGRSDKTAGQARRGFSAAHPRSARNSPGLPTRTPLPRTLPPPHA